MSSGISRRPHRPYPFLFAGVIGLILGALAPVATNAATPASGSIDGSKVVEWDFAPVAGGGLGGTPTPAVCAPGNCDKYDLNVVLPDKDADFYSQFKSQLSLHYTWNSSTPDDMDLFAFDPTGSQAGGPGSPDDVSTGPGHEDLVINNPQSGHWSIRSAAGVTAEPTAAHTVAKLTFSRLPGAVTQTILPDDPKLTNYESPPGFEGRDAAQRPDAGEPSIGVNWKTGAVMYFGGNQVARINFDDSRSPATAKWTDVTPPKQQFLNEDPILFTDHDTGRSFSVGLLLACSNVDYTDDDGSNWLPSSGCPVPHSPDHESLASGPFAPGTTLKPTGSYPHIVYYCSQNILQGTIPGAFCGHSEDGGVTFDAPSTAVFGGGTPCGAIHGHIRVSPDGTVYVPQRACGSGVGMAVSRDNGQNYTYSIVTGSTQGNGDDPSVAAGANNTVYYGYDNADGFAMIAVSHDHGKTWSKSINVGAPLGIKNTEFPEVWAGDDNRAAFAFLGTTVPGATQSTAFPGTWYLFVAYTYDGGNSWVTVNATPNDPVQRGCIWNGGGTSTCRNMLDFNEISVDKIGRVVVGYTDGCTADCETNPRIVDSGCGPGGMGSSENANIDSTPTCTYARRSAMVRQSCGKGLFAAYDGTLGSACYPGPPSSPVQASGGGFPTTGTRGPAPLGFGLLGAAALGAGVALAESRRRRRRSPR